MEQFVNSIGLLGGYFAVMLLLAVAVEAVLDVVKRVFGNFLQLRATVSPEQLAKDVDEWIPEEGQVAVKAAAVIDLLRTMKVKDKEIQLAAENVKKMATDLVTYANSASLAPMQVGNAPLLASTLVAMRESYEQNESNRVLALRLISALIGVAFALALQIDSLQLLAPVLPAELLKQLGASEPLRTIVHYGGILLTGLGASAGSSFWHDQLDKVRALKEAARTVEDLRLQAVK